MPARYEGHKAGPAAVGPVCQLQPCQRLVQRARDEDLYFQASFKPKEIGVQSIISLILSVTMIVVSILLVMRCLFG